MKKPLIISVVCLFVLFAGNVYSQTLTPPHFPGGKEAFSNFLHKNLKFPKAVDEELHGVVVIGFFVEKNGALTGIAIEKGMAKAFDDEALRVINLSPNWIPAMKNNKAIKSKYTVPICFSQSVQIKDGGNGGPAIDDPAESELKTQPKIDYNKIYHSVEKAPEFPGGIDKFKEYIDKKLKWPIGSEGVEGKVVVDFVVERNGQLTGIKIERALSPETDAEALRIICQSPRWKPGTFEGRTVRTAFSIVIPFKLNK